MPTCRPQTEALVIEWPAGEDHFGGCLAFGPDGMLYFSVGDGHGYADGNETGQDLGDLNASILRIDVAHPDAGKPYGVPADNPFVDAPGARPEVWAYGLRNVWKFSIDPPTGRLRAGDVGQDLWEPVVLVERGGNYGWSATEGTRPSRAGRTRGPTPILPPAHEHAEARPPTGGFVCRPAAFPGPAGRHVHGDHEAGTIRALRHDGPGRADVRELADTPLKLVAFGRDPGGELLLLDYQGTAHRLSRNPVAVAPDSAAGAAGRSPAAARRHGTVRVDQEPRRRPRRHPLRRGRPALVSAGRTSTGTGPSRATSGSATSPTRPKEDRGQGK